jgi:hypothetical protein
VKKYKSGYGWLDVTARPAHKIDAQKKIDALGMNIGIK